MQFTITGVNDNDADGAQLVTISADGGNGVAAADTLFIADDEPSEYQIDVLFVDNTLTPSQQAIFAGAAARWSQIIRGDVPDVFFSDLGVVDDVVIEASAPDIDGQGGILGQAGPTHIRTGSFLPARGIMQFDSEDVANLESNGQLMDVILHEMGHVIGIGTIWSYLGLLDGGGGGDPQFTGANATAYYNEIFGLSDPSVPVANTGGAGTRDSHWREGVFNNELMTGFLNFGANPISRVTGGSLADLGYVVDILSADPYTPPASSLLASESSDSDGGSASSVVDDEHDADDGHGHVVLPPPQLIAAASSFDALRLSTTFGRDTTSRAPSSIPSAVSLESIMDRDAMDDDAVTLV